MMGMLIREVKAHQDIVTSINVVNLKDFQGILTSGKDKTVANFNLQLDMMGLIKSDKTHWYDRRWVCPTNTRFEK